MAKLKKIELETKDMKPLVKLLQRGLFYTDSYFRDYKKMDNVFDKVIGQLESQGATLVNKWRGEINF